MKKLSIYFAAALCLAMAVSCSDDEDTTTKPSIYGLTVEGGLPYVGKGTKLDYKVDVSGLYTSGDELPAQIGLYYKVNSEESVTLTEDITNNPVLEFSYTPDASYTGGVNVTCYAYAVDESMYSATATASTQVIDQAKALTGIEGTVPGGQKYRQAAIGDITWMTENLYETASGLSYKGCEVMDKIFGRYYTYEEALTACPDGWHLPTMAEWEKLPGNDTGALMANASFLEEELWPYCKEVQITNTLKFNAIPVGYIDCTGNKESVSGENEYAIFWTASEGQDASLAAYCYIFGTNPVLQKGEGSKTSLALSVRCVK